MSQRFNGHCHPSEAYTQTEVKAQRRYEMVTFLLADSQGAVYTASKTIGRGLLYKNNYDKSAALSRYRYIDNHSIAHS